MSFLSFFFVVIFLFWKTVDWFQKNNQICFKKKSLYIMNESVVYSLQSEHKFHN